MINGSQTVLQLSLLSVFGLPLIAASGLLWPPLRSVMLKLAPWTALPALLLSLFVSHEVVLEFPWLFMGTRLGLDLTGQLFLFFTSVLWLLSGLYARHYLGNEPQARQVAFFAFYLLSMAGNLGLIVSLDMASFFLFYAMMSFCSYGLVVHTRDPDALYAGRVYIALVMVGEVLLFSAIAIIVAAGDIALPYTNAAMPDYLIALLLLAFGIKAGALPLHVWLPLAHPAAPVPASAVLSGAMIKAGLLGWLRFLPLGEASFPDWGLLCVIAGFGAAFYGAVVGVMQKNPKAVLAYSSISQMGLMTIAIGLGLSYPQGWPLILSALLIYAVHHGLAKGALFLGVGVAAHSGPLQRSFLLVILTVALIMAGMPLTSGAVAKTALKLSADATALPWSDWIIILLPLTAVGTTLLMARFVVVLIQAEANYHHRVSGLWLPWLILIFISLTYVWFWPLSLDYAWSSLKPDKLVGSVWPIIVGVAIAWAVWQISKTRKLPNSLYIPPGDLLVLFRRILPLFYGLFSAQRWNDILQTVKKVFGIQHWPDATQSLLTFAAVIEVRLRQWMIAGTIFVSLILVFFLLTAL